MHGKDETTTPNPQILRRRRTSATTRAAFSLWLVFPHHLRSVQQPNRIEPSRNVSPTLHLQLLQFLSLAASPEQGRPPQLHYLGAHPVDTARRKQPRPRQLANFHSQTCLHGTEQSVEPVTAVETVEEGRARASQ